MLTGRGYSLSLNEWNPRKGNRERQINNWTRQEGLYSFTFLIFRGQGSTSSFLLFPQVRLSHPQHGLRLTDHLVLLKYGSLLNHPTNNHYLGYLNAIHLHMFAYITEV